MHLTPAHYRQRRLESQIENRTVYSLNHAELNVYETHAYAEKVELTFDMPVLASMLSGKKIMHLRDGSFDFFPGESVVLPPGELMRIDFPEARMEQPTQCLALTFNEDKIGQVVDFLNDRHPRSEEHTEWRFTDSNFHFTNDVAVNQIIARLIFLFTENHPSKDVFADYMLRELIMRLMQTEARHLLLNPADGAPTDSRLATILQFIRQHLHDPLNVDQLSKKAHMSQTQLYRTFRHELGISPVDFINQERIKRAKELLSDARKNVSDIALDCGFNNMSYFCKLFRRATGSTPLEFRRQIRGVEGG